MLELDDIMETELDILGEEPAADIETAGMENIVGPGAAWAPAFEPKADGTVHTDMRENFPEHYLFRGRRRPWQMQKVKPHYHSFF